jgi:acylphosphatase
MGEAAMAPGFEFAHVIVAGRVQGVGFREFTRRCAQARGAAGFVRNRADGTVEARLMAPAEALSALIEELRRGPPHGRVSELRILERGPSPPQSGFRIAPTL